MLISNYIYGNMKLPTKEGKMDYEYKPPNLKKKYENEKILQKG